MRQHIPTPILLRKRIILTLPNPRMLNNIANLLRRLLPIHMRNPRNHPVNTGTHAGARPELAILDPSSLGNPVRRLALLRHPVPAPLVRGRADAMQDSSPSDDGAAGADGEDVPCWGVLVVA